MKKRIFWLAQGALVALVSTFGVSILMDASFGGPPQLADDNLIFIWSCTAAMTAFNTVYFIISNYKEPPL